MRFSVRLPTERVDLPGEFVSAEAVAEVARAAERLGYDAVFVTDHPIPDDRWLETGGHHALDPFVALAFAGAATTRLRLQTNLCVVPYRSPFLTAKAVASLDALSGGRFVLGAGAGYLEPEFRALGVDFERRNEIFDQALAVMKEVWRGESVRIEGHGFAALGHRALPRPVQRPHPPIWIGGNSRRAMRRAVLHGDGWMPFPNPGRHVGRRRTPALETLDDLALGLRALRAHAEAARRGATLDVIFMPLRFGMQGARVREPAAQLDEIGQLAALGVTQLQVAFPGATRAAYLEQMGAYAAAVMAGT
jgi:probable F420-dependent oxidoreductase